MGRSTDYNVNLIYNLKGNAQRGLAGLRQQVQQTSGSLGGLRSMVGLAFAGGAFALGKKYFYDYNNSIQQMKIGMGTIISMNFGKSFQSGAKAAETMFTNFQKMAIKSPATTKDFVSMSNMIASSVLQSGKSLADLEKITGGAITAAAALGALGNEQQVQMFARDISSMARGHVREVDLYAKQLLRGVGYSDITAYNKDVKSGKINAGDMTMKALSTPQLQGAAEAQAASTQGVMSTFQDMMEISLAQVGLPLMKAMTAEVSKWNEWIMKNPEKIKSMVDTLGNGLKETFSVLKDIMVAVWPLIKDALSVVGGVLRFASEHRDLLITLAKGLLAYKAVQFAGGLGMRAASGIGGIMGSFKDFGGAITGVRTGAMGAGSGLAQMAGSMFGPMGVIKGIGLFSVAAFSAYKLLTGETNSEKKRRVKNEAKVLSAKDYVAKQAEYKELLQEQRRLGVKPDDMESGYGISRKVAEAQAALEKTEESLVKQGLDAGALKQSVAPGSHRKVEFAWGRGTSGADDLGTMKANQQLSDSLATMINFKLEEANIVSGFNEARAELDAWLKTNSIYDDLGRVTEGYKVLNNEVVRTADIVRTMVGVDPHAARGLGGGYFVQSLAQAVNPADEIGRNDVPAAAPPKVDVTINKIEVASDDPDRFVHGMVSSFAEVVRNPTQARDTLRGGF